jgi:c-di-GMP-binding flagellar brake protein YcgR
VDISKVFRGGDEVHVGAGKTAFVSKVFDITGESSFTVLRPIGVEAPRPGDVYSVTCITERGIYLFKAEVTGLSDYPAAIGLKVKNEFVKMQRRSTFRVREALPVRVLMQTDRTRAAWVETTTVDISESGALVAYGNRCAAGQALKLEIRINRLGFDVYLPAVKGRVVRCIQSGGRDSGYLLGVEFEDLPERARNEIMRFVVLSQRSRMRDQHVKRYHNYG